MDVPKILIALCGLILLICLTLSITTLSSLRNAIAENGLIVEEAEELIDQLDGYVDVFSQAAKDEADLENADILVDATQKESQFMIKEINGKIAIYTAQGQFLFESDTHVSTLPAKEREEIRQGILCSTLEELLLRMQDYGS
ncbi:MAG: hypothetical protein IKB75_04055 [Clostridia bacterium]|nr:hypothetical protein [Clostridia bacterium]